MRVIQDGVWPVMITPFTEDNKIDYNQVLKLLEWYEGQGVAGVFAVCQSSEMFFLTKQERFELAKFIIDNAPENMGVVASGHVAETVEDQVEEAKAVIDAGADSYVFISNQFAKEGGSEDEAKRGIETLISQIPAESFGIYECPFPYKRVLSPELLKFCAETGKFSFLKDTCCDLAQLKAKTDAVKHTDLKIFNANAATLLESLKMGGAGYSGVMANFHADLYTWLCENFEKEPEKAERMQNFLGAASLVECQVYPVNAKYHMQLEGLEMSTYCRTKDAAELTASKQMEIVQFRAMEQAFRENFFKS